MSTYADGYRAALEAAAAQIEGRFSQDEDHPKESAVLGALINVLAGAIRALPVPQEPPTIVGQHEWIPSTLGHGDAMCRHCLITNREAAVLGRLNKCTASR